MALERAPALLPEQACVRARRTRPLPGARARPAARVRRRRQQRQVPMCRWPRRAAARSPSAAGGVRRPRRRAAGPAAAASAWAPPCAGRAASSNDRVRCSSIETSFSASHAVVRSRGDAGTRASTAQPWPSGLRYRMAERGMGGARDEPARPDHLETSRQRAAPSHAEHHRSAGLARAVHAKTFDREPSGRRAPWPSFSLTEPARDRSMDAPISGGLLGNHCAGRAPPRQAHFVPGGPRRCSNSARTLGLARAKPWARAHPPAPMRGQPYRRFARTPCPGRPSQRRRSYWQVSKEARLGAASSVHGRAVSLT